MTDSGAERAARMNRHAAMPSRPHRLPEREISPIGASIIDHPEMKRWEKQGYAQQRENGLWLHYSAICTLLRGERARADAAERELASMTITWNSALKGEDDALRTCRDQHKQLESLRSELREALAWKASMIAVSPPLQEIGQELNVKLGDSIQDKILPGIVELKRQVRDMREALTDEFAELNTFLGNMRRDAREAEDPELAEYANAIEQYVDSAWALLSRKEDKAQ